MKLYISFIFYSCFISTIAVKENCIPKYMNLCQEISGFNITENLRIFYKKKQFPDAKFLEEKCDVFKSTGECILNKIENDSDCKEDLSDIWEMIEDGHEKSFKLCDKNSDLRKVYTENINCMNMHIDLLEPCGESAMPFIKATIKDDDEMLKQVDEYSRYPLRFCLSQYLEEEKCAYKLSREKCGNGAVTVARNIINFVYLTHKKRCRPLLDKYLDIFKERIDSFNKTSIASKGPQQTVVWILLCIFITNVCAVSSLS